MENTLENTPNAAISKTIDPATLTKYLQVVVQQEKAVYTQDCLIQELQKRRRMKVNTRVDRKTAAWRHYQTPRKPEEPDSLLCTGLIVFWILQAGFHIYWITISGSSRGGAILWGTIFSFIFGCIVCSVLSEESNKSKAYNKWESSVKHAESMQKDANKDYWQLEAQYQEEYEHALVVRQSEIDAIDAAISAAEASKNSAEEVLQKLYSVNYIYPKYRTLAAACSICEYFESGRTDALQGTYGAYNLFEQEVRQDHIITQLDRVINHMEQIEQNQAILYDVLSSVSNQLYQFGLTLDAICNNTDSITKSTDAIAKSADFTAVCAAAAAQNTTTLTYLAAIKQ